MFNFLKRKPKPFSAEEAARTIFVVAAHESKQLPTLWARTVTAEEQYELLLEYAMFLLYGIDVLAYATYGDPVRAALMKQVLLHLLKKFTSVAEAESAAIVSDFNSAFDLAFQQYARSKSIMGEDSLVVAATLRVSVILRSEDCTENNVMAGYEATLTSLQNSFIAVLTIDPFQALSKSAV